MIRQVSLIEPRSVRKGLHRSYSTQAFIDVLELYPDLVGDPEDAWEWIEQPGNILLRENEDFGMFTGEVPGVYTGHYFFSQSRGRAALKLARRMLAKVFTDFGASCIKGLTPTENKPAAWITRRLGFTSFGIVDTPQGECEIFCITLDEFFARNNQNG